MSLAQKLLRSIEHAEGPLSTPELTKLHAAGLSWAKSRVWTELRILESNGHVRRVKRAPNGTYWGKVVDDTPKKG